MRAPRLAALLFCALVPAGAALAPAAARDHRQARPFQEPPAAAEADTSARVYVSLISGRDETGHDLNSMSINITNYGFIGNNFTTKAPSMEYPVGSGHDHLVRGGLWIGALAVGPDSAFTGVTTATVDGSAGGSTAGATEFSPEGDHIDVRSSLPNNRRYSPLAVSERDLIGHFDDLIPKRALNGGIGEDHHPLGVVVRQENYSWSFADYKHMVFFHWVITNTGAPLRNVFLGLYDELASGNKNTFSTWPPGASWFSKKQIGWVDSLSMFTESYCEAGPINSDNCKASKVPEVVGIKLLGVRPGSVRGPLAKQVTVQAWNYAPGNAARDEDLERYGIMSSPTSTVLDPLPADLAPSTGDPVELISVGPFAQLSSGDSLQVDFVYLGGDTDYGTLDRRAHAAQRAYDLNYIVPVPPPSPHFKAVVREGAVDYYWDDSPESFIDLTSPLPKDFEGYRVYAGEARDSLHLVAQFDLATAPHDTTGFNTGLDVVRLNPPVTIDGETYQYKYTLSSLRTGFKYFAAVTAYDLGSVQIESLESGPSQNEIMFVPAPRSGEHAGGVVVFPNPYRVEAVWDHEAWKQGNVREHYLWFANLPQRCNIRIYTLAGDLILDEAFDGATYNGSNARGVFNPANDLPGTFSGATFGWDLVTRRGQAAATGLYMWSVEDKGNGKTQVGKVLIVKSDREGFQ